MASISAATGVTEASAAGGASVAGGAAGGGGACGVGGGGLSVSGSGSWTSAIVRRGASRGTVASSPTAGSPLVSSRSSVVGVRLNVMPDDAV